MPAYLFVDVEITDDAAQAEYRGRSLGVIEAYGGRLMARGDVVESTAGELTSRRRMLALEFPSLEQARAWRDLRQASAEQTEVREIRNRMGNIVSISIVEGEAS